MTDIKKTYSGQCKDCAFWGGDDSSYAGACVNPAVQRQRSAFDDTCSEGTYKVIRAYNVDRGLSFPDHPIVPTQKTVHLTDDERAILDRLVIDGCLTAEDDPAPVQMNSFKTEVESSLGFVSGYRSTGYLTINATQNHDTYDRIVQHCRDGRPITIEYGQHKFMAMIDSFVEAFGVASVTFNLLSPI